MEHLVPPPENIHSRFIENLSLLPKRILSLDPNTMPDRACRIELSLSADGEYEAVEISYPETGTVVQVWRPTLDASPDAQQSQLEDEDGKLRDGVLFRLYVTDADKVEWEIEREGGAKTLPIDYFYIEVFEDRLELQIIDEDSAYIVVPDGPKFYTMLEGVLGFDSFLGSD